MRAVLPVDGSLSISPTLLAATRVWYSSWVRRFCEHGDDSGQLCDAVRSRGSTDGQHVKDCRLQRRHPYLDCLPEATEPVHSGDGTGSSPWLWQGRRPPQFQWEKVKPYF